MKKPFKTIECEQFGELRILHRLTIERAADLLHVTARTVANWESGDTRIPYSAFKLLRILVGHELPGAAWEGWCVRGDTLCSPANRTFKPHELAHISNQFAMARFWQADYELRNKRRQQAAILSAPTFLGRNLRLVVSGRDR